MERLSAGSSTDASDGITFSTASGQFLGSLIALLSCLVAVTSAAPQAPPASNTSPIPIIEQTNEIHPEDGSYKWSYETGNGIKAQEAGQVKNFGQGEPNEIQSAVGSFSYTAPDGTVIQLNYEADERGFVPSGAHLPTPPPIPPEIARAVEYLKSLPSTPETPARR